ncbi:MAG: aminoglycoside phosphotransferase family protein [Synechococcaceae cyanobacterium SM2_3_1]|nr:aminoglycoside phosphotransferase family protein [Synechococcaceae cyanobacterium SM2_3_1]
MEPSWLQPLVRAFQLGHPQTLNQLDTGLIQQSWRLTTERGIYICQRLHSAFDPRVTEDGQAVSAYLRSQGVITPTYLYTQTSDLHLQWQEQWWRVMPCLSGAVLTCSPQPDHLRAAGSTVGHLHQALASWRYTFRFQLPGFHDTAALLATFRTYPRNPEVDPEADFLLSTLPPLLLPPQLPRQIIHGDLKLANFLFDQQGQVTALLDLDTFMEHSLYVELGDALRSWASQDQSFNLQALAAGWEGYTQTGAAAELDPRYVFQGLKLITLELGLRFLKDYYDDSYFHWDPQRYPNRSAHNLARCRRQLNIYRDMLRQEDTIQTLLDRTTPPLPSR